MYIPSTPHTCPSTSLAANQKLRLAAAYPGNGFLFVVYPNGYSPTLVAGRQHIRILMLLFSFQITTNSFGIRPLKSNHIVSNTICHYLFQYPHFQGFGVGLLQK